MYYSFPFFFPNTHPKKTHMSFPSPSSSSSDDDETAMLDSALAVSAVYSRSAVVDDGDDDDAVQTMPDSRREMALVAVVKETQAEGDGPPVERERIVGVSRIVTNPDGTSCEFALVVGDDFAGRGLGTRLMLSIIEAARGMGLQEIMGLILTNNAPMLKLMHSLGFQVAPYPEDPDFRIATKAL